MAELVLDADWLVSCAQTATGLGDFGEASWREGLERYVRWLDALIASRGDASAVLEAAAQLETELARDGLVLR